VNRLTQTLTSDSHTHVRPKKVRAAVGKDLTAAQSIHDGRDQWARWRRVWMFGGRWRRLAFAAGPESVEDGVEAGFEVLGGVTLAQFIGSLDDLG
jgi:hypothetical protein